MIPGALLFVIAILLVVAVILLVLLFLRKHDPAVVARLESLERNTDRVERSVREELGRSREEQSAGTNNLRQELNHALSDLRESHVSTLSDFSRLHEERQKTISQELSRLLESNEKKLEQLRQTVEQRLMRIQEDNSKKLEEMRRTVDEQLQGTLERRLGEQFKLVSDRLEQVHKGLGEMQTLATGVGDLKRVLTNVKSRGGWGEAQLAKLLEDALTPDQYERNKITRSNSNERVEFAIRLPGREDEDQPVWLPIDAKFPTEDYERLLDAAERGDPAGVQSASRALESRMKEEAAKIARKYLEPPLTTDFAILFLPSEGLYAEALRIPGLMDTVQRDSRTLIAGPTTLWAILNSLQMGFRTLAIQKRSSEVWSVLSAVKSEFGKFGDVLDKVKRKLVLASDEIEKASTRTRVIQRKLRGVEGIAQPEEVELLTAGTLENDEDDEAEEPTESPRPLSMFDE